MANYTAYFRSNYFAVKDVAQFRQFCDEFQLEMITQTDADQTLYGILDQGNESGIPTSCYHEATQDWEDTDFLSALATHLVEDYVAIVMEVGFEKMRYLVGEAHAVNAKGEIISVELDEIYERSASLGRKRTSCAE
ncbi:MAG: hypothetical protein JNM09_17380 [Blastocatellia bacterium]|nr:hypothetical protein [Blastocatellia bacterium]